jgi:hypothetical protein
MDKRHTCIVAYADGPNSNFCLCLNKQHRSSRAKFVIHAVHGVRIKCSSVKQTNACIAWEGTPWKRLHEEYQSVLFGVDEADEEGQVGAACDPRRLVDKYEFLQQNFPGTRNLKLLQEYYSRLQNAAHVLNALRRCALTKKVRVHCADAFLDYYQNSCWGLACTFAPLAAELETAGGQDRRNGCAHVLEVTRRARAGAPSKYHASHAACTSVRDRVLRASRAWQMFPPAPIKTAGIAGASAFAGGADAGDVDAADIVEDDGDDVLADLQVDDDDDYARPPQGQGQGQAEYEEAWAQAQLEASGAPGASAGAGAGASAGAGAGASAGAGAGAGASADNGDEFECEEAYDDS